jgi:hypothetical protein
VRAQGAWQHHSIPRQACEHIARQKAEPCVLSRCTKYLGINPAVQRLEIQLTASPGNLARDLRAQAQLIERGVGDDRLLEAGDERVKLFVGGTQGWWRVVVQANDEGTAGLVDHTDWLKHFA